MKKRNRITVCLVAGVLILAVSAGGCFWQRQRLQHLQGSRQGPGPQDR